LVFGVGCSQQQLPLTSQINADFKIFLSAKISAICGSFL
jgi:hypothetical protein